MQSQDRNKAMIIIVILLFIGSAIFFFGNFPHNLTPYLKGSHSTASSTDVGTISNDTSTSTNYIPLGFEGHLTPPLNASDWKTYADNKNGYSIKYPQELNIKEGHSCGMGGTGQELRDAGATVDNTYSIGVCVINKDYKTASAGLETVPMNVDAYKALISYKNAEKTVTFYYFFKNGENKTLLLTYTPDLTPEKLSVNQQVVIFNTIIYDLKLNG